MDGLEPLPPGIAGVIGSGTTWHAKPSPQPLRLASQLMGIAPEHIAFVGDDRRDIDCARAVGARSIAALWGYIHRHDNPMDWGADRYAETPGQLARGFRVNAKWQPTVWCAMPVYNEAAFIAESLSSLQNQTYPNLRIVVSDNASTDGTETIAKEIAQSESRLDVVSRPNNIGAAANFALPPQR